MGGIAGVLSSFNTQPPEGGWAMKNAGMAPTLGFNTQPPEGGWVWRTRRRLNWDCFNTQPPEGGWLSHFACSTKSGLFQHTAARRRLVVFEFVGLPDNLVSTHRRPKAAGAPAICHRRRRLFQHTAARRRLAGGESQAVQEE